MKCGSEKLRSLVKEYFGEEELAHYDEMVDQCKLGQALKDDRVWAPLCPDYPNLKGVTCEEIDEFLEPEKPILPDFFYTDTYERGRDKFLGERWKKTPEKDKEKFLIFLKANLPPEEFDEVYKNIQDFKSISPIINYIEDFRIEGFRAPKKHIEPKEFVEDYLRHVKAYDRDGAYSAFKNIGKQIESDMPGVLHDKSTIFVTTPRGGHEMLSIFAYANDLEKAQVPSDITWAHLEESGFTSMYESEYRNDPHKGAEYDDAEYDTEIYGTTWMGHHSDPVKNIFIVDDIIASGEQIHHTKIELDAMFPGANINSVTLCKRGDDVLYPAVPKNIKYYTDTETIGINSFKDRRLGGVVGKEYITCIFNHACPDGTSDKLMVELMGDKRCSPEKRISKRDL